MTYVLNHSSLFVSDVFYCQEPLQQFLQRTYPRPSFLDQLLDNDPSLSISPHSTAGQDGGDESQGRGERGTDEVWEILGCEVDDFGVSIFLIRIHRKLKLGYPGAHTLIDGLEPVSKGLLTRYQAVRGKDGVLCDVCHESLDFDSSYDAGDQDPLEPIQTENKELLLALPYYSAIPEVVALPCSHPFHSECLLPWFAQKTTCPKCRFDVDPDSLVLRDGSAQRPWVPPATGVLEAWVKAEEEKVASGLDIGVAL